MHIKEFAKLTGVSVRALHYYDEIGLLKPSSVNEQNGYREYDEKSLERMAEILFYRELDFPLKIISEILSSPDYNKAEAIRKQKHLLTLKKERLDKLILALDNAEKGVTMKVFDNSEFEAARKQYADEAAKRWGNTDAYKEYEQKNANKINAASEGLNKIFAEFASIKDSEIPDSAIAHSLVRKLQSFITENFYTCTPEILRGLSQMYVCDDRFKANIDKNGIGTAEFVSDAIKHYCK